MSHLSKILQDLQLDSIPKLQPKAQQYLSQINQKFASSRSTSLGLAKLPAAIQLACEYLSVDFDPQQALQLSALTPKLYYQSLQDIRVALGITKHVTLEELNVKYGPPQGIIEFSGQLLGEFKQKFSATLPLATSKSLNWKDSVYVVAAFSVVCKKLKKRVVKKSELVGLSLVNQRVFDNVVAKLELYGKDTLKEVEENPVPTVRKRKAKEAVPATAPAVQKKQRVKPPTRSKKVEEPKTTSKRLRIGVISMIQERDYRDTQQYSNYLAWRTSMLTV